MKRLDDTFTLKTQKQSEKSKKRAISSEAEKFFMRNSKISPLRSCLTLVEMTRFLDFSDCFSARQITFFKRFKRRLFCNRARTGGIGSKAKTRARGLA